MAFGTLDKAQKFFDSIPQSRTLELTREQQGRLHRCICVHGLPLWGASFIWFPFTFFAALILGDVFRPEAENYGMAAMAGAALAAALAIAGRVCRQARTKKELAAGDFREYRAFLLKMEPSPGVEIKYSKEIGNRSPHSLRLCIANRHTGEEARFGLGGSSSVSASMEKSLVIVVFPAKGILERLGAPYFAYETEFFEQVIAA